MTPVRRVLYALLLSALVGGHIAHAADVPLADPVYAFLHRAELLGWLDEPLSGAEPFSRDRVARHLAEAREHRDAMSVVDRERLERNLIAFRDELDGLGLAVDSSFRSHLESWEFLPDPLYANGHDLLHLDGDAGWTGALNPVLFVERYDRPNPAIGAGATRTTVIGSGLALRLRFGRWSAAASLTDAHVQFEGGAVDSSRFPYNSAPTDAEANALDFFDASSSITYETDHVLLHFGHGEHRWGAGRLGALMLGDQGKPYTHVRAAVRLRPIEFTTMHGRLHPYPRIIASETETDQVEEHTVYSQKWISAQRLEVFPASWLRLGFSQQVIYGRRGLDIDLLNPLAFVMATEYYTGDSDNAMLGGDVRVRIHDRLALETEVLFDEFVFSRLGNNDYTNKYAFRLGMDWADPFGIPNSTWWAEYARIRPFVYSHKFEINRASHLGIPLGYPLDPNSDRITLGWDQWVARGLAIEGRVWHQRHGANTASENVGGDVRVPALDDGNDDPLPLLSGTRETTTGLALMLRAEPWLHLHVNAGVTVLWRSSEPDGQETIEETLALPRVCVSWYPVW